MIFEIILILWALISVFLVAQAEMCYQKMKKTEKKYEKLQADYDELQFLHDDLSMDFYEYVERNG